MATNQISTTGPTRVAEVRGTRVDLFELAPEDLDLRRARPEELAGGSPEENAAIARRILAGEEGARADIVAANAGAALYVAGRAPDLLAALALAREALATGAAAAKLAELREAGR